MRTSLSGVLSANHIRLEHSVARIYYPGSPRSRCTDPPARLPSPHSMRPEDVEHMREAIGLAEAAAAEGDVPVGAVIVCDGTVIARAANAMRSGGAIAHAEMRALAAASATLGTGRLERATLYVTLEPCAMCAGAIVLARLRRVVFAAWDDKAGMAGSIEDLLRHPRLNHRAEVTAGVLAEESAVLLRAFFRDRR